MIVVSAAALVLFAIAAAVCIGWFLGDSRLVQLRSGAAPMKFNAALGFLVFGAGAVLLAQGARSAARAAAVLTMVLGGATLAQNILHVDLHIDQLFVHAAIVEPGSVPGRMSPVTASLFVLCGSALLLLSLAQTRRRSTLAGLIASVVSGVSVAALIGYSTDTPVAYLGGALSGIAIHAAASFIVAAIALSALATRPEEGVLPHWAPWAALIWGLACTASLGGALIQEFDESHATRAPELTILIGTVLSALIAWGLHSRRELVGALAASARSEEMVRRILEAAPDAMLITDAGGRIVLVNDMTEKQFGYSRSQLIGSPVELLVPVESRAAHVARRQQFGAAQGARVMGVGRELVVVCRDGSRVPVEVALSPVSLRGQNLTVAAVRDITQRREAEQKVRESLQEKELLLKEIHHRVKNNLQVVASMLALQADKAATEVREPLEDCRQRVMSMALVHEKLYGAADLRRIDLAALSREIVTMLISEGLGPTIKTGFHVEPVAIDIERAVPASLILNELITNALKHAFKGRAGGTLTIAVRRCDGNCVCMEVADDGVGGLQESTFRTGRTLGMTIVRNLVRQLDGRLSVAGGPGTTVAISFPTVQEQP